MNTRPICNCGRKCAMNYTNKKTGKIYYRKKCYRCLMLEKMPKKLEYESYGYYKKDYCEKCGFKSNINKQIVVIKTKGVLQHYKSICLNCNAEVEINGWKSGDLTPDF